MGLKVVYTDYFYDSVELEFEILHELEDVQVVDLTEMQAGGIKDPQALIEHVSDADAIVTQFAKITREVIDAMPKCKVIARHAIGVDTIDVAAASERNIVVANVPDYCIEEVSDTAIAHILNAVRHISESDRLLRAKEWEYSHIKPTQRLSRQTVGLLAFGHIARRVAEKLRPFECRILAHDPYAEGQPGYEWVDFVSLETFLAESDVVSVHVPLNPQTHHMLNRQRFEMMKKGAIVVNTSRGGVIHQDALADAVRSGHIRAAGLDVLEAAESEYADNALLELGERVAISPHLAWYSEHSIRELKEKTARNVLGVLKSGEPLYRVNKPGSTGQN